MNKTKLEVIRINEDVIATSVVSNKCEDVFGAIYTSDGESANYGPNELINNTKIVNAVNAQLKNLNTGSYYHIDSNGKVIGECPNNGGPHGFGC